MKQAKLNSKNIVIQTVPFVWNEIHPGTGLEFVDCPEYVEIGYIYDANNDSWIEPVTPEPTPPPREWKQEDVRKHLTLSEKVSWDNDSTPEIVTAKNEFATGLEEAATIEVLDFLVSSNNISEASKTAVLA